ncbi:MAG: formylglycine-generating enzyme family protein [Thiohalospira sp.]
MTEIAERFTDEELVSVHELDRDGVQALQQRAAEAVDMGFGFRDLLADGGPGPELAVIPAGRFLFGSSPEEFGHKPDEAPRRWAAVRRPFAMGRFTVTAAEFQRYQEATGFTFRSDLLRAEGDFPVMNLRIEEVQDYLRWLSEQTGARYRLPTEVEWEYACRAGTRTPFAFGESVDCHQVHFNPAFPYEEQKQKKRWFLPRCLPMASALEVGRYPCNAWGLHDMHGNIWEFTASRWSESLPAPTVDEQASTLRRGKPIVVRGGSYFDMGVRARSAARQRRVWDELDVNIGFRVVREL